MIDEAKIKSFLGQNGISPLPKRVKIMRYLIEKHNHPTVDMIYSELLTEIPGLSRTTVYNTLKLFTSKQVAVAINIEDNEIRYDADTAVHGHFKCRVCDGVFDFSVRHEQLPDVPMPGFVIDEYHYYLKGICSSCKEKGLDR